LSQQFMVVVVFRIN